MIILVIVHTDKNFLEEAIEKIRIFLGETLTLELHPNKVEIRKLCQGTDFLGYVSLPHSSILRTKTKNRILRKMVYVTAKLEKGEISKNTFNSTVSSYQGVLSHCRSISIQRKVKQLSESLVHY